MLHNKGTTILSEINDFFTTSEKAMDTIFRTICSLKLSGVRFLGSGDWPNLKKLDLRGDRIGFLELIIDKFPSGTSIDILV